MCLVGGQVRISTKKQVERHRVELLKALFGAVARYRHYTAQYRAAGDHQPLHNPTQNGVNGGASKNEPAEGVAKELGEMEDALWSTQTVIGSIEHVVSRSVTPSPETAGAMPVCIRYQA